jgi:hypothetical protein
MATKPSTGTPAHASADLRAVISVLLSANRRETGLTLHDVRLALQGNSWAWTQEGELLHSQDRTALLIEIDELIEKHGMEASARSFLPAAEG